MYTGFFLLSLLSIAVLSLLMTVIPAEVTQTQYRNYWVKNTLWSVIIWYDTDQVGVFDIGTVCIMTPGHNLYFAAVYIEHNVPESSGLFHIAFALEGFVFCFAVGFYSQKDYQKYKRNHYLPPLLNGSGWEHWFGNSLCLSCIYACLDRCSRWQRWQSCDMSFTFYIKSCSSSYLELHNND